MYVTADGTQLRRYADWQLYDEFRAIAGDPFEPGVIRRRALSFAPFFYRHWIKSGHSGLRIPPGVRLQLYGNHCGPGWGRPDLPVLDSIDAGCKAHDHLYRQAAALDALALA